MNTLFQQREVHKYTRLQFRMDQKSLIDLSLTPPYECHFLYHGFCSYIFIDENEILSQRKECFEDLSRSKVTKAIAV